MLLRVVKGYPDLARGADGIRCQGIFVALFWWGINFVIDLELIMKGMNFLVENCLPRYVERLNMIRR